MDERKKELGRRTFLLRASAVGAGALLVGCGSSTATSPETVGVGPEPVPTAINDAASDSPAIGKVAHDASTDANGIQDASADVKLVDAGVTIQDAGGD